MFFQKKSWANMPILSPAPNVDRNRSKTAVNCPNGLKTSVNCPNGHPAAQRALPRAPGNGPPGAPRGPTEAGDPRGMIFITRGMIFMTRGMIFIAGGMNFIGLWLGC